MKQSDNGQELSYYGLYLRHYLQENRFQQASDADFINSRAALAAETFGRTRCEGYSVDSAQEQAMEALLDGLHRSAFALLTDVLENEFEGEVPLEAREPIVEALLPQVRQLCAQNERTEESLYTEITGIVVLYLERHGI
ncbi:MULTISPECIES: DUF1896 family protein [Prevotella]|uniref:DUF1896 domain-containing protein n=1 Tax=Prevotella nigrescens CC14M TaxID=1073366 RepID=V8CLP4_9BACT|nr:DUF1896 family protein [Prevotella nigrescens]ETD28007.1 hypothetical protein HMPREF1173_02053 [Prevotella nigrescens CC14M]